MRFEVAHLTRYTYDRPVLLEPLIVRLRPRSDIFQRLVAFDLAVEPQPEGMSEMIDAEGNTLSQVWFLGLASMLTLRTTFAIETLRTNPFDYIVLDPDSLRMPMTYDEADRRALAHYLQPPTTPRCRPSPRTSWWQAAVGPPRSWASCASGSPRWPRRCARPGTRCRPGRRWRCGGEPAGTWRCSSSRCAGRSGWRPASSPATRWATTAATSGTCTPGARST